MVQASDLPAALRPGSASPSNASKHDLGVSRKRDTLMDARGMNGDYRRIMA